MKFPKLSEEQKRWMHSSIITFLAIFFASLVTFFESIDSLDSSILWSAIAAAVAAAARAVVKGLYELAFPKK